jgi:hypothetical protein
MSAEQSLPPEVSAWFDLVDRRWQRLRVPARDRARLRLEAEADVTQSLAEGAAVADLVTADPALFATEVAEADGVWPRVRRRDLTTGSLLVTALGGAALTALVLWWSYYPAASSVMDSFALDYDQQGRFAVGAHVVAALLCACGAAGAVRWRFRSDTRVNRTTWLTGLFLLLGGAASVGPTTAVAGALDYSTESSVVLLEILLVLGCCALGVLAARWVAARDVAPT